MSGHEYVLGNILWIAQRLLGTFQAIWRWSLSGGLLGLGCLWSSDGRWNLEC